MMTASNIIRIPLLVVKRILFLALYLVMSVFNFALNVMRFVYECVYDIGIIVCSSEKAFDEFWSQFNSKEEVTEEK